MTNSCESTSFNGISNNLHIIDFRMRFEVAVQNLGKRIRAEGPVFHTSPKGDIRRRVVAEMVCLKGDETIESRGYQNGGIFELHKLVILVVLVILKLDSQVAEVGEELTALFKIFGIKRGYRFHKNQMHYHRELHEDQGRSLCCL